MKYLSTRGDATPRGFSDILLEGLAPDGGLYLPERYPRVDAATLARWRPLPYAELALEILSLFIDDIAPADLARLVRETYTEAVFGTPEITPNFDRLASEGLLFSRFFSNGTHTHQGMFATMGCFPNLPGFEYLMQTPEGSHDFSGLPQLLNSRGFDNLYVYNGDFAWDNQSGFFGRQGMSHFIGRFDFKNPIVFDPTWGVSDQDMFDRAAEELVRKSAGPPFSQAAWSDCR